MIRKVRLADGRQISLPALGHVEQSYEISDPHPLLFRLVFDRKAESIRLEDYFAAIYLNDREVLVPFWGSKGELDLFAREYCGITDPVWFYLIDFYMWVRDPSSKWQEDMIHIPYSPPLNTILDEAAKLALAEAGPAASMPKMGLRHVMSAVAAHPELEFTRDAFKSGMKRRSPRWGKRKPSQR
jgi:hypothetical protein